MESQSPPKIRVIDNLWTFAIAVAFIGPFALPLLWRNPRFSKNIKLLGSAVIILITAGLIWFSGSMFSELFQMAQQLKEMQNQSP